MLHQRPHRQPRAASPLRELLRVWLNSEENKNKVITYARQIIPDVHPLVALGWRELQPHVWEVASV